VKFFDGGTKGLLAMGPDSCRRWRRWAASTRLHRPRTQDQIDTAFDEPYIYHFPDGNASIARLLVRSLIPGVAPGHTMDDVLLAEFDYTQLDRGGAPLRLRLNSTAGPSPTLAPRVDRSTSVTCAQASCIASKQGNACSPATT